MIFLWLAIRYMFLGLFRRFFFFILFFYNLFFLLLLRQFKIFIFINFNINIRMRNDGFNIFTWFINFRLFWDCFYDIFLTLLLDLFILFWRKTFLKILFLRFLVKYNIFKLILSFLRLKQIRFLLLLRYLHLLSLFLCHFYIILILLGLKLQRSHRLSILFLVFEISLTIFIWKRLLGFIISILNVLTIRLQEQVQGLGILLVNIVFILWVFITDHVLIFLEGTFFDLFFLDFSWRYSFRSLEKHEIYDCHFFLSADIGNFRHRCFFKI